jgi:RimK-like ATP-grasp domain
MKNIMVSPWKGGTPRRLCKALDLTLMSIQEMQERHRDSDKHRTLVNWGVSAPFPGFGNTLNRAPAVATAANKLATFRILKSAKIPTLEFTKDKNEALKWLEYASVICHTNLHGHGGSGLELVHKGGAELPPAKVYTKYFAKKTEARVHVIKGLSWVEHLYLEKRRIGRERWAEFDIEESPTTYIRTYENGWIFARNVVEDSHAVKLAMLTMECLHLDYAAVDIMRRGGTYVVGEVNTAPGLEGQSLEFYVNNLRKII